MCIHEGYSPTLRHQEHMDVRRWRGLSLPPRLMDTTITSFALLFLLFISASGLKITKLTVPELVDVRETATLICHYDLQNRTLNSVKWYKGEDEFFRYTPGRELPRVFPVAGIDLDLSMSNDTQVTLRALTYNTTGHYKCEVSAEAPTFDVAQKGGNMTVLGKPRDKPALLGLQTGYAPTETIRVNCTSDKSHPPATLQWFVNGKEAEERWLVRSHRTGRQRPEDHLSDLHLQSTTLGLVLSTQHHRHLFFHRDQLQLNCVSTVGTVPPIVKEAAATVRLINTPKTAPMSAAPRLSASLVSSTLVSLLCLCRRNYL